MGAVDLVFYDLDGTLVETAPEICDAVNDLMDHYGWPAVDQAQIERWIGHGTGILLLHAVSNALGMETEALRASGRMDEIGPVYDRFYAKRCGTRSRLYPDVSETLAALHAAGIRGVIVTNKESRYTDRVLSVHKLADRFDRVLCGDTMPARKPDPAGMLECLESFGVPARRSLFVGDSSIDVETARAAGVPIWLVPYGYNMGQPIAEVEADRIIDGLAELAGALVHGPLVDSEGAGGRRVSG